MTMISLFSTLTPFLLLFLCLGPSSLATAKYADQDQYFQILAADILPSATSVCNAGKGLQTTYAQGKGALKLVDRHGPCSPFSGEPGSAVKSAQPDLTEILQHDQSRIRWINSWASPLSTHKKQIQDPFQTEASTQLPARPGTSLGTLNYIVTVGVGTPKTDVNLVLDTGSSLSWVQCEPCNSCYPQEGPMFRPSASSTFERVSCTEPECDEAKLESEYYECYRSVCIYGLNYIENSSSIGPLVRDTLTLTGTDVVPRFTFGCGQRTQGIVGKHGGILGLDRTKLSVVSQARNMYGGVFSYCLPTSNNVGHLTFGPDRSSYSSARFVPLLPHPKFYYVPLTGMSVGGRRLPVSPSAFGSQGTLLDSGTVVTRLPPVAYSALRSAFRAFMAQQKYPLVQTDSAFDTCYNLSSFTVIQTPKIAFHFQGGTDLVLSNADNILIGPSLSLMCLGIIGNAKAEDSSILGNCQLKTTEVVHDIPNSKIGFIHGACS